MRKTILEEHKSCAVQKTARKKHQILEKWDNFQNRPHCKGYSPCKGYSLCKMVGLGHKLKMSQMWEKLFHKNNRVVLCKKLLEKHQIFEKCDNFENGPSCKGYSLWKMVGLGQKLKMSKHAKNYSART